MVELNDMMNKWKMTNTNEQVLTTFDWEFEIKYTGNVMLQPPETTVFARTLGIDGVTQVPQHQLINIPMRGFTILQPGLTVTTPSPVSFNVQDFEDQTITTWLWDWVNKMNSLATLASFRRSDLFCDIYIWQLNSSRKRVWQYEYYNCLPEYQGQVRFDSQKENNQMGNLTWQAEYYITKPMNIPNTNKTTTS